MQLSRNANVPPLNHDDVFRFQLVFRSAIHSKTTKMCICATQNKTWALVEACKQSLKVVSWEIFW